MANDIGPSDFKAHVDDAYSNDKTSGFKQITPGEYKTLMSEFKQLGDSFGSQTAAKAMIFGHAPLLDALSSGASYADYVASINPQANPNEFKPQYK